ASDAYSSQVLRPSHGSRRSGPRAWRPTSWPTRLAIDCAGVKGAVELAWVEQPERVGALFERHHGGDVLDHAALLDHVAVRIGYLDADLLTEGDHGVDLARIGREQRRQPGGIETVGRAHELDVVHDPASEPSLKLMYLLERDL